MTAKEYEHHDAAAPEPVAYFDLQKREFYWARPTQIDAPTTVDVPPLPLYAAPPPAAPRPEPVFDGQSGHPVMLPRAPEPVLGLISDEVCAALKAADAVESQEAYRTRTPAVALSEDIETLRRENERLQNLLYDQMGKVFASRAAEQMRKQIAELKHAENERLREALKKYGRHLDDCALTLGGYQCTCGFNQQEVPR